MEFLFRTRPAGKRQVKPSQDIALLEEALGGQGESSDDSDFKLEDEEASSSKKKKLKKLKESNGGGSGDVSEDSSEDSSSSSGSSSGDSSDEDGSSDADDEEDDDGPKGKKASGKDELRALAAELNSAELFGLSAAAIESSASLLSNRPDKPVCGCCLGASSSDVNEVVECDGCGVSVHEGCYGVTDDAASIASTVSEASTEPWFCEPCRHGLRKPPTCELCPALGGLYKQTEVGRWVHLVCALYVPGVAFGDPEHLRHVTVFEMNYASYGRWPCALCDDDRLARSGVAIQCDAGMCRARFHVVCAQAHGLLTEPNYSERGVDAYIAHCKMHTDKTVVRRRRANYLGFVLDTRKREEIIKRRIETTSLPEGRNRMPVESEDQRILRKLLRSQERFHKDSKKKSSPWIPTQKIHRAFTTSSSAVRKLQRLGEIEGVSKERQRKLEQQVSSVLDVRRKWALPAAFTAEYVAYYHDRTGRIQNLRKQLSDQIKSHSTLREEEASVRPRFDLATANSEAAASTNRDLGATSELYRTALVALCPDRPLPFCAALAPLARPLDIVAPNVRARSTVWATNQSNGGKKAALANGGGGKKAGKMLQQQQGLASPPVKLRTCQLCRGTHNQHLLAHCDTCRHHYHIGCLTPPLTRIPKKNKLYGWQCSECTRSSDSEAPMDPEELMAPRKRRQAAARASTMAAVMSFEENNEAALSPPLGAEPPAKRPKKEKKVKAAEDTTVKDEAASNGVGTTTSTSVEDAQRESLILQAASTSSEHKRKKEKKKKKKKKKNKEREREKVEEQEEEEDEEEEEDIEIIETDSGTTVRIRPKLTNNALKLKIKPMQEQQQAEDDDGPGEAATNPSESNPYDFVDEDNPAVPDKAVANKKKKRRSSSTAKDLRTHCDKCDTEGSNENLVRCDECRKCFHFECLSPPVKKSPKVAGYSWHCDDCDPSEVDSDWHLD